MSTTLPVSTLSTLPGRGDPTRCLGLVYGDMTSQRLDFEETAAKAVDQVRGQARALGADAVLGLRIEISTGTSMGELCWVVAYGSAVVWE